jgi:hypothetical protein
MGLSQLLGSLLGTDRVDELARRIAERSHGSVWQRVAHRIDTMAGSEARGYVRARAGAIVLRETNLIVAEENLRAESLPLKIYQAAIDRLIELVVEQSRQRRLEAAPARKVA